MVCFNDQPNETTSIIQKSNIGEIKKCSHCSTQLNTSHTTLISLFQMDKKGRKNTMEISLRYEHFDNGPWK